MICYDVAVNGRRLCLAGGQNLRLLEASLRLDPKEGNAYLTVGAHTEKVGISTEDLRWAEHQLGVGDHIELRILQAPAPDPPTHGRFFGTRPRPDGGVDEACSFCAAVPRDDVRLVRGWAGNICGECISLCNEILENEDSDRGA